MPHSASASTVLIHAKEIESWGCRYITVHIMGIDYYLITLPLVVLLEYQKCPTLSTGSTGCTRSLGPDPLLWVTRLAVRVVVLSA